MKSIRSRTTSLVVAVVTVIGTLSCASQDPRPTKQYCATMADSIGLYVGNPVTQMGYRIGTVTAVSPGPGEVQVTFALTEQRKIPADVKAVTRSTSILADRSLELVGNYSAGPELVPEHCISRQRTATPRSLSQVVGSMATFVDSISPPGSDNVDGAVDGLQQLLQNQGGRTAEFLTRLSAVLDSPDRAISDTGSVVANLATLTTQLNEVRPTIEETVLATAETTPDLVLATDGVRRMTQTLPKLITMVSDLETELGGQTQQVLDTVSVALRKLSPHAMAIAGLLDPIPGWITTASDRFNEQGLQLKWRPPMYRIRTQDGLLLCGQMNARVPGSCADIAGTPYAVDVALLQYVLMEASR